MRKDEATWKMDNKRSNRQTGMRADSVNNNAHIYHCDVTNVGRSATAAAAVIK